MKCEKMSDFESAVSDLLTNLPDTAGRARVLGVYLSLHAAQELGYDKDSFRLREKDERNRCLPEIARANVFERKSWSELKLKNG
jgi:hypothetical protein